MQPQVNLAQQITEIINDGIKAILEIWDQIKINYTQEELQEIFRQYTESLNNDNPNTPDT